MKSLFSFFLVLFFCKTTFSQSPELVFDASEDPTCRLSSIKEVNGEILFSQGRPGKIPEDLFICGMGDYVYFQSHVFALNPNTGAVKKKFHQNFRNQFIYHDYEKVPDTSSILNAIFIPFSDSSGVFFPRNHKPPYLWCKKGDSFEKLQVPEGWKSLNLLYQQIFFSWQIFG